jgi:hypothetical protein
MKREDFERVFKCGGKSDLVAVTTCDDKEVRREHYYGFTALALKKFVQETRNAVLEEAALYIEHSGSKSRKWLSEGLRHLKEQEQE